MANTRPADFLDQILKQAMSNPSAKAISADGQNTLTYGELYKGILQVSASLKKLIAEPSRLLFLLPPDVPSNMMIALGAVHAGHGLVIVNPFTSDELFASRVGESGATHILADKMLLTGGKHQLVVKTLFKKQLANVMQLGLPIFSTGDKDAAQNPHKWRSAGLPEDLTRVGSVEDPAVVVFTSGTTDKPKGIIQSFASLSAGFSEAQEWFKMEAGDNVLSEPMTIGLLALSVGAHWVQKISHRATLASEKIDIWFGTPYDASALPSKYGNKSYTLKTVGIGAGPVLTPLVELLDAKLNIENILCVYGMTEILPISIGDARMKASHLDSGDYVGRPLKHVGVKVEDNEIFVTGTGVSEYIDQPTSETGWLATGDYGTLITVTNPETGVEEPGIALQGRKKDMFIRRDMNIYPGLYEPALTALPGVQEAYITGVPGKLGDDLIVLIVRPDNDAPLDTLKQTLSDGFPKIMDADAIPDEVILLHGMTPVQGRANKLDRGALATYAKKQLSR